MTDRILLTVEEAAAQLGVKRTFMYGLVMRGEVPSLKLGKARRIPAAELGEWVRHQVGLTR